MIVKTIIVFSDNTRREGETFKNYEDALAYVTQKKMELKGNKKNASENNIVAVSAIVDMDEAIDKVKFQD